MADKLEERLPKCQRCNDTGRYEIPVGGGRYIDRYISVPCDHGASQAADEITRLNAENERLTEERDELWWALRPFGLRLKNDDRRTSDAAMVVMQYGFTKMYGLSVGDLRRARALITKASTIRERENG